MNYIDFVIWLKTEKQLGDRSANDVVSRLKRSLRLASSDTVNANTLNALNSSSDFSNLSIYIKSQLRRSVILYQEFSKMI